MEEPAEDSEDRLDLFKEGKCRAKTSLTRARRKLLSLIDDDHPPRRNDVRNGCENLDLVLETALQIMENLSEEYSRRGDRYNRKKVGREMEQLESEFTEAQNRAHAYLDKTKPESSTSECVLSEAESARSKEIEFQSRPVSRDDQDPPEEKRALLKPHPDSRELRDYYKWLYSDLVQEDLSPRQFTPVPTDFPGKASAETPALTIGREMWTQLKRVAIPVFSGNKKTYESWKAAFIACIDKAPATPEYKLLQLRQYLSGEALKTIENLGHSGYAYEAAKERLERKFGGQRRQNAIRLEELENFKPLRPDNSKDLEDFADLLDIAVTNLKDVNCLCATLLRR